MIINDSVNISLKQVNKNLKMNFVIDTDDLIVKIVNPKNEFSFDIQFGVTSNSFGSIASEIYTYIINNMQDNSRTYFYSVLKPYKKYVYIRTNSITKIVYNKFKDSIKKEYNLTDKELTTIRRIVFRNSYNKIDIAPQLIQMKNNDDKIFNYALSDLMKIPVGYAHYILKKLQYRFNYRNPIYSDSYIEILQNAHNITKKNKYMIFLDKHICEMLESENIYPKNKIQYQLAKYSHYDIDYDNHMLVTRDFGKKLISTCDYNDILYFKKEYEHNNTPYYKDYTIHHLVQTILDGYRINIDYRDYGSVSIKGSVKKMIQKALYNHRIQRDVMLKERLNVPNAPMVKPPYDLPSELENMRIKTKHEMITAGIECEHCIGSYINDNKSMFFRDEKDCCIQVSIKDKRIVQCFDTQDRITDNSRALSDRVRRLLLTVSV